MERKGFRALDLRDVGLAVLELGLKERWLMLDFFSNLQWAGSMFGILEPGSGRVSAAPQTCKASTWRFMGLSHEGLNDRTVHPGK